MILVDAQGLPVAVTTSSGLAPRKRAHPRTLRLHAHQGETRASHWRQGL
jgi:hypothetical protein